MMNLLNRFCGLFLAVLLTAQSAFASPDALKLASLPLPVLSSHQARFSQQALMTAGSLFTHPKLSNAAIHVSQWEKQEEERRAAQGYELGLQKIWHFARQRRITGVSDLDLQSGPPAYDSSGHVLPRPGISVNIPIPPNTALNDALVKAQQRLFAQLPAQTARKLRPLAAKNFHITVAGLTNDNPNLQITKADIEAASKITRHVAGRSRPVTVKIGGLNAFAFDHFIVTAEVRPEEPKDLASLNSLRAEFKQHYPDMIDYPVYFFHVSLAYAIQPLTPAEMNQILDAIHTMREEAVGTFSINSLALQPFNNVEDETIYASHLLDAYADFYENIRSAAGALAEIKESDLARSRTFIHSDGLLESREKRRANGVFGITEVYFVPPSTTLEHMATFQRALQARFGRKLYLVDNDKLHFTTQGLETLATHMDMHAIDPNAEPYSSVRRRARAIPTEAVSMNVGRINWDPSIGIFWELNPRVANGSVDPIVQRRRAWALPQPRPPHITAAYFAQPFSEADLTDLRRLIAQYQEPVGTIEVDRSEVIAYEDLAFNSGYRVLETVPFGPPSTAVALHVVSDAAEAVFAHFLKSLPSGQLIETVAAFIQNLTPIQEASPVVIQLQDALRKELGSAYSTLVVDVVEDQSLIPNDRNGFLGILYSHSGQPRYRVHQALLRALEGEPEFIANVAHHERLDLEGVVAGRSAETAHLESIAQDRALSDFSLRAMSAYHASRQPAVGSAAQVGVIGIPETFSASYLARLRKTLGNSKVSIRTAGFMTMEANVAGVDKALAVGYVEKHFEEILTQAGYTTGSQIDARKTRTVIFADGDGTSFGKAAEDYNPPLHESEARDALVSYLEAGGVFVLVSGNDLELTRQRLAEQDGIPEHLRNRVIVVTMGGANLATFKPGSNGQLQEFRPYRDNALKELESSQVKTLDAIFLGDAHKEDGNDFPGFQKIGFKRAVSVASKPQKDVPPELQWNYVGGEQAGTRDVLRAVVEHAKPGEPVFSEQNWRSIIDRARTIHGGHYSETPIPLDDQPLPELTEAARGTTILSADTVQGMLFEGGNAIRSFFGQLVEHVAKRGDAAYQATPEYSKFEALIMKDDKSPNKKFWEAIAEYRDHPDHFTDQALMERSGQQIPRIEVRGMHAIPAQFNPAFVNLWLAGRSFILKHWNQATSLSKTKAYDERVRLLAGTFETSIDSMKAMIHAEAEKTQRPEYEIAMGIVGRNQDAEGVLDDEWNMAQNRGRSPPDFVYIGGGGAGITLLAHAMMESLRERIPNFALRKKFTGVVLVAINSGVFDDGGHTGVIRRWLYDSGIWPKDISLVQGDQMSVDSYLAYDQAKLYVLDDKFRPSSEIDINMPNLKMALATVYEPHDVESIIRMKNNWMNLFGLKRFSNNDMVLFNPIVDRQLWESTCLPLLQVNITKSSHELNDLLRSALIESLGAIYAEDAAKAFVQKRDLIAEYLRHPLNPSDVILLAPLNDHLDARTWALTGKQLNSERTQTSVEKLVIERLKEAERRIERKLFAQPDDWIFFCTNMISIARQIDWKFTPSYEMPGPRDFKLSDAKWQNLLNLGVRLDDGIAHRGSPDVHPEAETGKMSEILGIAGAMSMQISRDEATEAIILEADTIRVKLNGVYQAILIRKTLDSSKKPTVFYLEVDQDHIAPDGSIVAMPITKENSTVFRTAETSIGLQLKSRSDGSIEVNYNGRPLFVLKDDAQVEGKTHVVVAGNDIPLPTDAHWTPIYSTNIPHDMEISVRGRLVEEQTHLTDDIHPSRVERFIWKKPNKHADGSYAYVRNVDGRPMLDSSGERRIRVFHEIAADEYPQATDEVLSQIRRAHKAIVFGDTGLITNVLPNLMCKGVIEAIVAKVKLYSEGKEGGVPCIYYPKLTQDFETMGLHIGDQLDVMERSIVEMLKVTNPELAKTFHINQLITHILVPDFDEESLRKAQQEFDLLKNKYESKHMQEEIAMRRAKLSKHYPLSLLDFANEHIGLEHRGFKIIKIRSFDINPNNRLTLDKRQLYRHFDQIVRKEDIAHLFGVDVEHIIDALSYTSTGIALWPIIINNVLFKAREITSSDIPGEIRRDPNDIVLVYSFPEGYQRAFSLTLPRAWSELSSRQKEFVQEYINVFAYNRLTTLGATKISVIGEEEVWRNLEFALVQAGDREYAFFQKLLRYYYNRLNAHIVVPITYSGSDFVYPIRSINGSLPVVVPDSRHQDNALGIDVTDSGIRIVHVDRDVVNPVYDSPWNEEMRTPNILARRLQSAVEQVKNSMTDEEWDAVKVIGVSWPSAISNGKIVGRAGQFVNFSDEKLTPDQFVTRMQDVVQSWQMGGRFSFGKPVILFKDANATAFSHETMYPKGEKNRSTLYLGMGERLGAALVKNGGLDVSIIGEMGNVVVDLSLDAPRHSFTKVSGALQQYLSQTGLLRIGRRIVMGQLKTGEINRELGQVYGNILLNLSKNSTADSKIPDQEMVTTLLAEAFRPKVQNWKRGDSKLLDIILPDEVLPLDKNGNILNGDDQLAPQFRAQKLDKADLELFATKLTSLLKNGTDPRMQAYLSSDMSLDLLMRRHKAGSARVTDIFDAMGRYLLYAILEINGYLPIDEVILYGKLAETELSQRIIASAEQRLTKINKVIQMSDPARSFKKTTIKVSESPVSETSYAEAAGAAYLALKENEKRHDARRGASLVSVFPVTLSIVVFLEFLRDGFLLRSEIGITSVVLLLSVVFMPTAIFQIAKSIVPKITGQLNPLFRRRSLVSMEA